MIRVHDQNRARLTQGINLDWQAYNDNEGNLGTRRRSRNAWKVAPALMRELYKYDHRLKVVWDNWKERWCIWRESAGADYFVYTVADNDGGYRDLDFNLIRTLMTFDCGRYTSPHAMAMAMEQEEEAAEEKVMKEWRDDWDYATHHNRRPLKEALDAAANGLPMGVPKPKTESRKAKERYLYDDTGRKLCRITCSTAASKILPDTAGPART